MKFSHPQYLFLLWGILPLAGLMVYGIRRHKKILARFADPAMLPYILPGFSYTRKWIKAILCVTGIGFAIVSLSGPKAGFHWEKTTQKGVDIMIALDCSRSMLAQDVSPTRLTRAKREIIDLTRLLHSDRAGLVAFAGQAVMQCPLTLDYSAFHIFLDALTPEYLPVGGTNLTAALTTCYNAFEPDSDTEKAIILITDGEDTAQGKEGVMEMAQTLAQKKIRVFAIGVGDPAGAPVPGKAGGFEKDDQGNIVLSKVDETMLKKITATTQGRYVRSVAGDMDLELIYSKDILENMARRGLTQGKKKVWAHRYQWFLFPAVLVLLFELVLGNRPASRGIQADPRMLLGVAALLVSAGLALPVPVRAGLLSSPVKKGMQAWEQNDYQAAKNAFIEAQLARPDDLRLYYNIGAAAYAAGEYDLAESNFVQAAQSKDTDLRHKALYNLANTRYRQGRLADAEQDYESLLSEFPDDAQARENLAFVKDKIEQEKQRQQQQKDQDSKNMDQKNKDSKNQGQNNQDHQNSDQQNQDLKNQDLKNQNRKGGQQNGQDQKDQKGQDQKDSDSKSQTADSQDQKAAKPSSGQDKPVPQPQSASHGEKDNAGKQGGGQAARGGGSASDADKTDAGGKVLENRLNRLEDKPGMALMPAPGREKIEKDW